MSAPRRPKSPGFSLVIELYRAKGGHRWRLRSRNGRIIAESGEAYSSAAAGRKAATAMSDMISLSAHPSTIVETAS